MISNFIYNKFVLKLRYGSKLLFKNILLLIKKIRNIITVFIKIFKYFWYFGYTSRYMSGIKFAEKTLWKINFFKGPESGEHMLEDISEKR